MFTLINIILSAMEIESYQNIVCHKISLKKYEDGWKGNKLKIEIKNINKSLHK